jgi:UDP-N-acetylmuramoyl-tripeptide--D-alanyl-D-alanine ligase
MKEKFKKFIVSALSKESGILLRKFRPEVIAITGNVGKTTTKDYLNNVLSFKFGQDVRAAEKSQNSEFGVALTIFGVKNPWNNALSWLKLISTTFIKKYFSTNFPSMLVLEVGADHPGDIKHITSFVKPDTVILTAFQDAPTHAEFFSSKEEHIREKKFLVDALKVGGKLIYNSDDQIMSRLAENKEEVDKYSFGKNSNADLQILESANYYDRESILLGTKVKLKNNLDQTQDNLEILLPGVIGDAQSYSLAAAVLTAILKSYSHEEIILSCENIKYANSRMRILPGVLDTTIVDDSYNSSPKAVLNAFKVLQNTFVKGRNIFVLGHMAELGAASREEHIKVAKEAATLSNIIIFSGRHNDFFLEGIKQTNFDMSKVFLTKNSEEVLEILEQREFYKIWRF